MLQTCVFCYYDAVPYVSSHRIFSLFASDSNSDLLVIKRSKLLKNILDNFITTSNKTRDFLQKNTLDWMYIIMSVIVCKFRNVKIVNTVGLLGSYQLSCTCSSGSILPVLTWASPSSSSVSDPGWSMHIKRINIKNCWYLRHLSIVSTSRRV